MSRQLSLALVHATRLISKLGLPDNNVLADRDTLKGIYACIASGTE